MKKPDLDPDTLRWVADELERSLRKPVDHVATCEAKTTCDYCCAVADLLVPATEGHVKRLRARATRIERKRSQP